jgi:hypothetical protein
MKIFYDEAWAWNKTMWAKGPIGTGKSYTRGADISTDKYKQKKDRKRGKRKNFE